MRATYLFSKTEERRCDALSKLNTNQITFNMNMINESINEEKATLDDDYDTFSGRVISCPNYYHMFLHSIVYNISYVKIQIIPCQALALISFTRRGSVLCVE